MLFEPPKVLSHARFGIAGRSSADVWAVGTGQTIMRWNGTAWSLVSSGTSFNVQSIWGSSATDAVAVGVAGTISRLREGKWVQTHALPVPVLNGVSGSSAANAWAVGDGGAMLRWNGTSWLYGGTGTAPLYAVWMASATSL